jgi:hypothetical protein
LLLTQESGKNQAMKNYQFEIRFKINTQVYCARICPSSELKDDGLPISFHVMLNDVPFGYMAFDGDHWTVNQPRPKYLVDAVGKQIEKKYLLTKTFLLNLIR